MCDMWLQPTTYDPRHVFNSVYCVLWQIITRSTQIPILIARQRVNTHGSLVSAVCRIVK